MTSEAERIAKLKEELAQLTAKEPAHYWEARMIARRMRLVQGELDRVRGKADAEQAS
jgi:hypothetical protein